ncbi:MAG: leucine-rich repeat domain-containing protein, partial [Planctomycetota bacterium]
MAKNTTAEENDLTQARALIKECQESRNPYLDLGKCGITDLNDLSELFECNHLETLILSNSSWSFDERKEILSCNKGQNNKLDSIPFKISNLKKLIVLIISGQFDNSFNISDIRFLEKLTGLQTLDLSDNQISDIRSLEKLTGLQSLCLRCNQIPDYSFLEKLTGLQTLNLRGNQISDIRFLEKLTGLQSLSLRSNQISDIRFLEKLTGLQSLYLSGNQISDIRFLEKLTGLQTLNLSYNQISDIRFLEKLTGL